ncbi:MAG: hypothetical protein RLN89_03425 [Parvibaculum sp.]
MDDLKLGWTLRSDELRITMNGDVIVKAKGDTAQGFADVFSRDPHGVMLRLVVSALASQAAGEISLIKQGFLV